MKEPVVRVYGKDESLDPIKRFWYDVYVTEMGRDKDKADHARAQLDDPRAERGELIVAFEGPDVVGTLICTPSWTDALGDYEQLYAMQRLGDDYRTTSGIITKLMVAPAYRHSLLSLRISCELYRHAVPLGVHHAFIDCNDHLLPFFRKIGFVEWIPPVEHPDYGRVNVLKLDCLDLARLEEMRSPIYSVARRIAPTITSPTASTPQYGAAL